MTRTPVLIDFDNTFYQPGCDVDDAMALLYLLACPAIELVGMTSTYGNHSLAIVHENTLRFRQDFNLLHIPYAKGAIGPGTPPSEASQLIVELCHQYPKQLKILGLGALTNFYGAYQLDPNYLNQIEQIVLMGGLHQPLIFAKQEMAELNFSCDPQASHLLLSQADKVSVMTGNHCLDLLFTQAEYEYYFANQTNPKQKLIQHYTAPWFLDNEASYGIPGFYNWDSLAAAYLAHPHFFQDNWQAYHLSQSDLTQGFLRISQDKSQANAYFNTPKIDPDQQDALRQHLYQAWCSIR